MEKDLSALEKKLGVEFKNKELLQQALVHRSFLNEHPSFGIGNNERLEFLGDAVLELVVTEHLFKNYSEPEGELTNWRASLVRSEQLAIVANDLGVEKYLYLSKGETNDKTPKARQTILANACEAIIGATYLDRGLDVTRKFIEENFLNRLENILEHQLYRDSKSLLQEMSQEKLGITPVYKVVSESGPDHKKHFVMGVWFEKEMIAEGEGSSKQAAQLSAAENALKVKNWE
ncbi:MAG: ribonuclease III [Patescibacteria group bacterium]